jgi:hypothetical protein
MLLFMFHILLDMVGQFLTTCSSWYLKHYATFLVQDEVLRNA